MIALFKVSAIILLSIYVLLALSTFVCSIRYPADDDDALALVTLIGGPSVALTAIYSILRTF